MKITASGSLRLKLLTALILTGSVFFSSRDLWAFRTPTGSDRTLSSLALDAAPVPPEGKRSRRSSIAAVQNAQALSANLAVSQNATPLLAYLQANPQLLGLSAPVPLRLDYMQTVPGASGLRARTYVHLIQQYQGVDVAGSGVSFSFDPAQKSLVLQEFQSQVHTDIRLTASQGPTVASAQQSLAARAQSQRLRAMGSKVRWLKGQWRLVQDFVVEDRGLRGAVDTSGQTYLWSERYYADYSGAASGRGVQFDPSTTGNNLNTLPLINLEITDGIGVPAFTDTQGHFAFTTPSTGNVPVGLTGRWSHVIDLNQTPLSVAIPAGAPSPVSVLFNPSGNLEFNTAQVNGYVHATRIHDWLAARGITTAGLDVSFTVNVNVDATCNAFYDGASINFFKSGAGCINTAYDSVVYHEYGHFVDDMFGGITEGGLSEGWGDILATYATGQPLVGEGFFGTEGSIRNAANTYQYNPNDEVHNKGQAWMGFAWDLRQKLIALLGQEAGVALAENLVLPVYLANSVDIPSAMRAVARRDSPDGQMDDGPHMAQIQAAAANHGLGGIFESIPPTIAITSPANGAILTGIATVSGTASDNTGVAVVQIQLDGLPVGNAIGTTTWTFALDTSDLANGAHTLTATAVDGAGNTSSATVSFSVTNTIKIAAYSAAWKAPACLTTGSQCSSGQLLIGRDTLLTGAEPNQPNTIQNSCADGTVGVFHIDESVDRLQISALDGGDLSSGKTAKIDAKVWAYNSFDYLDLYYAADASAPQWTYVKTLPAAGPGQQVLSSTFTLGAGSIQAIRANFRYVQLPSACTPGAFDDHDDLVFAVQSSSPPPQGLADLKITQLSVTPTVSVPNGNFQIDVVVQNQGSAPASSNNLQVALNLLSGSTWGANLPTLAPGEQWAHSFFGNAPFDARLHALHAFVTTASTESNTANNDAFTYLTVATSSATDTYLSDLPWKSTTGDVLPKRDQSLLGNPITLNGVVYPKGLGAQSPTDISFPLPSGQQCAFISAVGLDDEQAPAGSGWTSFFVAGDASGLYLTDVLKVKDPTATAAVDVTGKQTLLLRTNELTGGNGDHADWAGARLHCNLAPDLTPPAISNIQAAVLNSTSVRVSWDTNELATTRVDYGPTPEYGYQAIDYFNSALHHSIVVPLPGPGLYHYKIVTADPFLNMSFSADRTIDTTPQPACSQGGTNAFVGCYYDDTNNPGGKFSVLKLTRTDPAIYFDWLAGSPDPSVPADSFSARWKGTFTFSSATYRFIATADDGVRLYIDGSLVIDQWHDQSPTSYAADVFLAAGAHQVQMEYYENGGGALAKLTWSAVASGCEQGGTNAFTGCYYDDTGSLPGSFKALKLVRTDAAINFDWGAGSPDPSVPADSFSVRWKGNFAFSSGTYLFTAKADDGMGLYVDGVLLINQWHDQPPTAYTASVALSSGTHLVEMDYYEHGGGALAQLSWARSGSPLAPAPAASLTLNGTSYTDINNPLIVGVGAVVTYAWVGVNADLASSTLEFTGTDTCGDTNGQPWVARNLNGVIPNYVIPACNAGPSGASYTLTYTVSQSTTGLTATTKAYIRVMPGTAPLASLTLNGASYTNINAPLVVGVGAAVTYAWSGVHADTATSTLQFVGTDTCGDTNGQPWVAQNLNGVIPNYVIPACNAGPSGAFYILTYTVTQAVTGLTATTIAYIRVIPSTSSTNAASFVKTDNDTQGNWKGTYGSDGFWIHGDAKSLPAYAQVSFASAMDFTWADPTLDIRALQKNAGTDRIASAWYSDVAYTIDLNLTDGATHQVGLYVLDWDKLNRAQRMDITDFDSGALLDTRSAGNFQNGQYYVWNIHGHVRITIAKLNYNAVVEGLFFGSAIGSQGITVTSVPFPLASLRVFPNPFRAARGDTGITFDQIPAGSTVKIFTVSARWVKTLPATGPLATWDLTNDSGDRVASGIYLYLITDPQGNTTRGKIGVIR